MCVQVHIYMYAGIAYLNASLAVLTVEDFDDHVLTVGVKCVLRENYLRGHPLP